MKFYCDSCNTKYAISDDKVRGKVLKVRCKYCANVITVRELQPVATPPKPPVPTATVPQTNWHFSINGATTGPMGLAALKAKYSAGEIGDETYVWHDTFDGWKPVATVPIFAEALRKGFEQKPRFETRAYTGVSEAVQAEPSKQRLGLAPKKPEIGTVSEAPNPQKAEPKINEARMDKLRKKLSESPLKKPQIKLLPLGIDDPKLDSFVPEKEEALPNFANGPEGLGFSPTLPDSGPSFSGAADPIADTMLPDDINSGFAPMDDISDELPNFGDTKPKDLFDPSADAYGLDTSSDAMPFFPDDVGPALGSDQAPSEVHTSSKSLLIEIDKIKKTDRKKSIIFIAIGVVGAFILISIATFMYVNREIEEVAIVEKVEEREAKILGYSKDQIEAGFVELEDMVIGKDEIEEPDEENSEKPNPEELEGKTKDPKTKKGRKKIVKSETKKEKANQEKSKLSADDLRKKLLSTGTINRPEDSIGTSTANKSGLSRVQAQAGFKKVSRSVSTCRQRHANRSGKELESAKVKISVEVLPTGKVSTFRISPGALRHTAFDSCMKSKKETWRFAKFGGKPVKINRTFILQ